MKRRYEYEELFRGNGWRGIDVESRRCPVVRGLNNGAIKADKDGVAVGDGGDAGNDKAMEEMVAVNEGDVLEGGSRR